MNELTVIENDLVPVYVTDAGEKVVYGTDLHRVLKVKSNYREWINRRLSDIDALENEDFQGVEVSTASGQSRKEHIIKLDAAKEMAMLERNEIGKQVRKYFIDVEKRHKQSPIDRSSLSPQMQMFYAIADGQAKMELEQKRQAEQLNRIEENQRTITDTFQKSSDEEDFKSWCKRCISKIISIGKFTNGSTKAELFRNAWSESFDRLNQKRPCNLKQRVINAKGIALESGKTKTWIEQNINNLSVISSDKDLRPAYESVMREMMVFYCVDTEVCCGA